MNNNERFYPQAKPTGAGPEFGLDANSIKTKTFDLEVARNNQAYEIGGNVLWAIAATDPNAIIEIRLNDQLRDPLPIQAGLFLKGVRFSRIYVSNETQIGDTITILYCVEEFNNIAIENPAGATASVALANDVDISKATHFYSIPDVTVPAGATQLIHTGNNFYRTITIGNLSVNTKILRIGDAGCNATEGIELSPGASISIDTTADIYAYNTNTSDQKVSIIYTTD